MAADVLRYAAFTTTPAGGNPAGVVLDAGDLDDAAMQAIAAEVGYAETAFVVRAAIDGDVRRLAIRYFSPIAEVPFCGHATVATAVALARRDGQGDFTFETPVGAITLSTSEQAGLVTAAFTSVEPSIEAIPAAALADLLNLFSITAADLHPGYPPALAFGGNVHPVLVLADRARFDSFTFDPAAAREMLDRNDWPATIITIGVVGPHEFEARNVFPVGTISEDPATGAAAAAFGGYLRELGLVTPPSDVRIHQGRHVGRPSLIDVHIPVTGGIVVSGAAVEIPSRPLTN